MSAVARLLLTYCAAARTRQALLATAIVMVVLAGFLVTIIIRSERVPAVIIPFALMMSVVLVVLPATYMGSMMFRRLSASRIFWFAPYARVKMLTAALLFVAASSMIAAAPFVLLLSPLPTAAGVGPGMALLMFSMISAFTWMMFLPPVTQLLFPVVLFPALYLLRLAANLLPADGEAGFGVVVGGSLVCAALWSAFALWYVRTGRISPMNMSNFANVGWESWWRGNRAEGAMPAESARSRVSLADSHAAYWHARPSRRLRRSLLGGFAMGLAFLGAPMAFVSELSDGLFVAHLYVLLPLALAPFVGLAANLLARRSRFLWLRGMRSREALFDDAEQEMWRSDAPTLLLGAALVVLVLLRIVFDMPLGVVSASLVAGASGAVFAAYCGMAYVRGLGAAELSAIAALLATLLAAGWVLTAEGGRYDLLAIVVALQLAGALWCRAAARRRWLRIDWTRFKPPRAPLQGLPS